MRHLPKCILASLLVSACSGPGQSFFIYRLPYPTGTEISIWQDHTTHAGDEPAVDMVGINGTAPYPVVAARAGTIRVIEDDNMISCLPSVGCENNYVWIQHPGKEWTKYSHLVTGTVSAPTTFGGADLEEGDTVFAGQYIGLEGNIGMVQGSNNGRHLHFEVREVSDTESPNPTPLAGDLAGPMKIPRFCGVPGAIVEKDETYTASACPN